MTVTKQMIEGQTYRVEMGDDYRVEQKADPTLVCTNAPTAVVPVGTTVQLHFQLRDFDGEDRTDNRDVALIVEDVPGTFTLVNGRLDLNLDLQASGAFAVCVATADIAFTSVEVQAG
jgi:hypothetical protein